MELAIGLLTIVIVLDCLFLILLVLVQLPKKEAGLGQAFGGGTTDALFGAGAGNVLTKLTTWCAGFFMVLALVLSIMHKHQNEKAGIGGDQTALGPGTNPAGGNQQGQPQPVDGQGKQPAVVPAIPKPISNNTADNNKTPIPSANGTAENNNTPGSATNGTTSGNGTKPQPAPGNVTKPAGNASKKN